jgi:hypothetical protein
MQRFYSLVLSAFLLAGTIIHPAVAADTQGEAYQGYSGAGAPAGEMQASKPAPVEQPQEPAAPVVPPPVAAAAAPSPPPVDPCAAYMASYNAYTVCQDRMQKLQRMKDAKKHRDDDLQEYYSHLEKNNAPTVPPQPVLPTNGTSPPVTPTLDSPRK